MLLNPFTGQRAPPLVPQGARIQVVQESPSAEGVQFVRWRGPDGQEACIATDAPAPPEGWAPVAVYDDYDTCLQNLPAQAPVITPPPDQPAEGEPEPDQVIPPADIVNIPTPSEVPPGCPTQPILVQCPPPVVRVNVPPAVTPTPVPVPVPTPPSGTQVIVNIPGTDTAIGGTGTDTLTGDGQPDAGPGPTAGTFRFGLGTPIVRPPDTVSWCNSTSEEFTQFMSSFWSAVQQRGLREALGFGQRDGVNLVPDWLLRLLGQLPEGLRTFGEFISSQVGPLLGAFERFVSSSGPECNPGFVVASAVVGLLGVAERLTGFDLSDPKTTYRYYANALCPTLIPSPDQATEAYLAGSISRDTLRLWVTAGNQCWVPWQSVLQARQTRPGITEAVTLYNRGEITEQQYRNLLRANGVLSDEYARYFTLLGQQTPNATDLVQFMVKDAFDERTSEELALDDEFRRKFTAEAEQLFAAAGIDARFAQLIWRSHWQQASVGQMFEMLHRLRPEKYGPDVALTEEQILRFLGVQDILPFWRKRLLEISYNPLTRVDTQRAFFVGAITRDEVLGSYLDQGYSRENAERLTRFTELLRLRYVAGQTGAITPTRAAKAFGTGSISKGQYEAILRRFGYDEVSIAEAVRVARENRQIEVRAACVKASIRRFEIGEVDFVGLQTALIDEGVEPEDAISLARGAECRLRAKGKSLTAAKLCQLFERGLLSAAEFSLRLVRLGHTAADAQRVVSLCQLNLSDKIAKRVEQLQRRREAEAEKLRKEREKGEKESQKQREKRLKEVEKRAKEEQKRAEQQAEQLRRLEEKRRQEAKKEMKEIGKRLDKLLAQQAKLEQAGEDVPFDLKEEIDFLQEREREIEREDLD